MLEAGSDAVSGVVHDLMTETIKQRYEQDCFLCCLAMAAGLPYDEALAKWGAEFVEHVSQNGLVGRIHIERAFSAIGLVRDDNYRTVIGIIPGNSDSQTAPTFRDVLWGRRACVQVPSKNYAGRYHIVFWDGRELHDPSPLKTYTWSEVEPVWIWLFDETS